MQTDHAKATVHLAHKGGPARYTGGAPMPEEPTVEPVHEEVKKTEHHEEEAHAVKPQEGETAKTQQGSTVGKVVGAVHSAAVKTGAKVAELEHKLEDKIMGKANKDDTKWFARCFPKVHEQVKAAYKCTFIDGADQRVGGMLAVTDGGVHFAIDEKHDVRHTVLYKTIASFERTGTPTLLNIYTTDRNLYRFTNFHLSHAETHERPESAILSEAHSIMDRAWRKAADVPNPAATYFSS